MFVVVEVLVMLWLGASHLVLSELLFLFPPFLPRSPVLRPLELPETAVLVE